MKKMMDNTEKIPKFMKTHVTTQNPPLAQHSNLHLSKPLPSNQLNHNTSPLHQLQSNTDSKLLNKINIMNQNQHISLLHNNNIINSQDNSNNTISHKTITIIQPQDSKIITIQQLKLIFLEGIRLPIWI